MHGHPGVLRTHTVAFPERRAEPTPTPRGITDGRLLLRLATHRARGRPLAHRRPGGRCPCTPAAASRPLRGLADQISARPARAPRGRAKQRRPASTASIRLLIPWPWRAGI
ncbi:MAG: hypothetical protein H6702_22920 [Myxococcales bacterium]|nr:hypothetical protein [Myxococcales bacterium]